MTARSNAVLADSLERVLIIERIFDAPRELIFKYWTEPEHFARWIGPKGFSSTILAWELRQGGNYRIHKRGPDGQDHWQQGVFREIVPPERIVRTYCWTDADGRPTRPETLLTLTFADLGGRTRLTLHQATFESVTARDDHQRGWSSSLDQLTEYIATV
jgi:uncharacterized protein YndB with AHSA1/START domain